MTRFINDQRGEYRVESMAESIIGLFEAEVIRPQGPWRRLGTVEYDTLEWGDWYNNRRRLGPGLRRASWRIGDIPPVELDQAHYDGVEAPAVAAELN